MSPSNLKAFSRYTDSISFIYIEHAVIEREDQSVAAFTDQGRIDLPAANLGTLLLGPGTRITHGALNVLSSCGCVLAWVGEEGLKHYAVGQAKTRSSASIEKQCRMWADDTLRGVVVRRMYELRFGEAISPQLTLNQIRGKEGARVRDAYRDAATAFGVQWSGRAYKQDTWDAADPVNKALSAANAALYAVVLAGLHSLGFSPALGFIHTGKQLSFVYDVSDLYKMEVTVPAAFEAAVDRSAGVERRARRLFRERAHGARLLDRLGADLARLFGDVRDEPPLLEGDAPGDLWSPSGPVRGGVLYGDSGD